MKKNLKKAISAVIALAVAASLVPATFAAKLTLTDVADTASYATAVNTLVALDVINGYEDGTFLPDNLITRAEVTKVIVAALNQTAAAEGMAGATEFKDVAADSWANGFINAGVQAGFINGMGDGTFAPQANVTYAQVVKMLVSSLGYEDYAQYLGGWPNGYLSIAATEGVTDGVKANANDTVTRAQVAQLVYNAINTPIVENTGMEYSDAGVLVPTIAQQNGKKDTFYKTILTENFDAYLVEGYVIGTSKVSSSLDADEVNFGIAKSEKYNAEFYTENYKTATKIADIIEAQKIKANVGDTDAANYLNVYATAIIAIDEFDEYTIVSFAPSGKNKTVEFTADMLDDDALSGKTIEIDGKEYDLEEDADGNLAVSIYVNGYEVERDDGETIADLINEYVYGNEVGAIELVDTYRTNGYYDAIYADVYATYELEYVDVDAASLEFGEGDEISLDKEENEDLVYSIYLDGEEIEISDLLEGDILSIAYDINKDDIDESDYYEIYVSRTTVSGRVSGRDPKEKTITVGGEVYSFVDSSDYDDVSLKDELLLTLDYFGRIYDKEIEATSVKYAIIDKAVYTSSEEAYKVTLYTVDGVAKVYVFDGTDSEAKAMMDDTYTTVTGSASTGYVGNGKKEVEERVVEYTVSSSTGKLTKVKFIDAGESTVVGEDETDEYEERYSRIGNIKMSSATKVIDVIDYKDNDYKSYSDIKVASDLSVLVDGTEYQAYAFGTKKDGKYPVVLIKSGEGAYNATTRFAVVTGNANEALDENDETYIGLPVLYKGEATTLAIAEDKASETEGVKVGDIIFFQTDSNGQVDQIDVIYTKADLKANLADLSKLVRYPTKDRKAVKEDGSNLYPNFKTLWDDNGSDSIKLVLAPVVEKDDDMFSLGTVIDIDENDGDDVHKYVTYKTKSIKKPNGEGGVLEVDLADDTNVYVYDPNETKEENQWKNGAISATTNAKKFGDDEDIVDWSETTNITYAFAMVVGNEATDVVIFKPAK